MRCASLVICRALTYNYPPSLPFKRPFSMARKHLTPSAPPRRSPRFLQTQASVITNDSEEEDLSPIPVEEKEIVVPEQKKRSRATTTATKKSTEKKPRTTTSKKMSGPKDDTLIEYLPRTREAALKVEGYSLIMGIDEAGRGPLCGPVVTAAAIVPSDIEGITDSKKITQEEQREALYNRILESPNIRWAVAVMDAAKIDQVNILQATLEGMRICAHAVLHGNVDDEYPTQREADIQHTGCYIICGATDGQGKPIRINPIVATEKAYSLIDGNRLPKNMACEAETIVKGDSKEFSIAAASILAKVTRDRLMHAYDKLYPEYDLKQNKGYPTAFHMKAVREHGATIIHRRTFAPLKHMDLDANGKIVQESENKDS